MQNDTQKVNLTMIIHAQKEYTYTAHSKVAEFPKYFQHDYAANVFTPGFSKPMFKTKYNWPSDRSGNFDPEFLNDYLEAQKVDPERKTDFNITVIGAEFAKCLQRAFEMTIEWEKHTHYLNRTKVTLPGEGVLYHTNGAYKTLSSLIDRQTLLFNLPFMIVNFFGQAVINHQSVDFHFKKRPMGIFDHTGKCLVPREIDTISRVEREAWVHDLLERMKES